MGPSGDERGGSFLAFNSPTVQGTGQLHSWPGGGRGIPTVAYPPSDSADNPSQPLNAANPTLLRATPFLRLPHVPTQ